MIIESVVLIIFVASLGGIIILLSRKIPILNSLSQNGTTGIKKHPFVSGIEDKIKSFFLFFKNQIIFHRFLSWLKCRILKIECGIDNKLQKIRKKAQQTGKDVENKK